MEDFAGLLELLQSLPTEVFLPALIVFLLLYLAKWVGVVGENDFARWVNIGLSFFAAGGLQVNTVEEAAFAGATSVIAAGLYKVSKRDFWNKLPNVFKKA